MAQGLPFPSSPAAEEYQADWLNTLPELERLRGCFKPRTDVAVMRSSQVDAGRLDEELTAMLREQFMRVFALFRPGLIARLQPELTLLLEFLIFRFSVWEGRPLPGMALMNLRFRDERTVQAQQPQQLTSLLASPQQQQQQQQQAAALVPAGRSSVSAAVQQSGALAPGGGRSGVEGPGLSSTQRGLYCAGAVFLRYGWGRLVQFAALAHWGDEAPGSWRKRAWVGLRKAEDLYRAAALVNLLAFLRTGRYRSLLERLLQARAVYKQPSAARAISFEYLNRQLVWHELSELLLFLLPLVDLTVIRRSLRTYLPRLPTLMGAGGSSSSSNSKPNAAAADGQAGGDTTVLATCDCSEPCGICGLTDVLVPYQAQPCGHLYCYYCLRSQCQAEAGYTCPQCLVPVTSIQRCRPQV